MKNLTLSIFLTLAVLLGTTGMSWGADFNKAVNAYESRDYTTALHEWTVLAEQGHAEAQAKLGGMYDDGFGVTQDHETAVKWFTLAAEQGNTTGQNRLGLMYTFGYGVEKNVEKGIELITLAAEQGDADAQYNLGISYSEGSEIGIDVVEDDSAAVMWFTLAAEQGMFLSQWLLGEMLFSAKDYVSAYMWGRIADRSLGEELRERAAHRSYGEELRERAAQNMTASQIERAEALAQECIGKEYKNC